MMYAPGCLFSGFGEYDYVRRQGNDTRVYMGLARNISHGSYANTYEAQLCIVRETPKNQGHLMCTQNPRISKIRNPTQDPNLQTKHPYTYIVYLSIYLSIYRPILSLYRSICPSIYRSIDPLIDLSIYLPTYLSVQHTDMNPLGSNWYTQEEQVSANDTCRPRGEEGRG